MKGRCALWMSLLMLAGTSAIQAQATLSIPDFQIRRDQDSLSGYGEHGGGACLSGADCAA